jgi:predicted membrane protein
MQLLAQKQKISLSRAFTALALSVVADAMEFLEIPLFAIPVIGEVPNAVIVGALYTITRNKKSTALNLIKFIPVLGSIIPVYTITALMWIYTESRKQNVKLSDYLKYQ